MSRDIWLISDTHWNHANILKFKDDQGNLTRPEFSSAKEMNDFMLEKWNEAIKPSDKVWHFGDVFFGSFEEYEKIHNQLNGHKRLLLGNHDNDSRLFKMFQKVQVIRRFDEFDFVGSHIPMHTFSCFNHRKNSTLVNVHGHVHTNDVPDIGYVNISCERTGYAPIHLDDVIKLVNLEKMKMEAQNVEGV